MTAEQLRVAVRGGELAVGAWGPPDGPVVVAVHGITSSQVFWTLVGERLAAAGVRLLAPDLRGRGRSADLPGPSSLRQHADDVVAVLDAAGVERAVLVGHSMGGFVATVTARAHPARVARLVLVDGGPPLTGELPPDTDVEAVLQQVVGPSLARLRQRFPDREAYRAFWRAHPSFAGLDDALVVRYADHDLVRDGDGWRSAVREDAVVEDGRDVLLSADVRVGVAEAAVGVTFLHAERGMVDQPEGLYPVDAVARLVAANPRVTARLVPDTNHFTIGMAPHGAAAVAAAVREALEAT